MYLSIKINVSSIVINMIKDQKSLLILFTPANLDECTYDAAKNECDTQLIRIQCYSKCYTCCTALPRQKEVMDTILLIPFFKLIYSKQQYLPS